MKSKLGIRREDKNEWERRAPLAPEQVESLVRDNDIEVILQPSDLRVFTNEEYIQAGAKISEDLSSCPVILGVKEIPADRLLPRKTYLFFSHTMKGQPKNMPMLRKMMDLGCRLIDYEGITDTDGRRLVFFGRFAGLAGMIDSLWGLGRRLQAEGFQTALSDVRRTMDYGGLDWANEHIAWLGDWFGAKGLPDALTPMLIGFAGYGNVSKGAQEVIDLLPIEEIQANEIERLFARGGSRHVLYKVVFDESDTVEPKDSTQNFSQAEFVAHPDKYRSRFDRYLPRLTVLMNCTLWRPGAPRLVSMESLKRSFARSDAPRLRIIGDVSCDAEGAIECNAQPGDPGTPFFTFDPNTGESAEGLTGAGVSVLSVDNLPAELPEESTRHFGKALLRFLPPLAAACAKDTVNSREFPSEIQKAVVMENGQFANRYANMSAFLEEKPAKRK